MKKKLKKIFFLYFFIVRLITESTFRWVTPFQHMSKVFLSFVLAGCLDTWEIIGVVKFISLFTLYFFVIEQYSNHQLDFVKRNCCTGIRVALRRVIYFDISHQSFGSLRFNILSTHFQALSSLLL
jgi:hypothetical protein